MRSDKIILYIIELFLIILSLCFIIYANVFSKTIIAIVLAIVMFVCKYAIKENNTSGKYNKKITSLMVIIAIFYLAITYVVGIYIGFYNSTVKFSLWAITTFIIPHTIIIIAIENIRKSILLKQDKFSKFIIFFICLILDIAISTNLYNVKSLQDYFSLIGFVIFSSIAHNLLYNYIIIKHKNCVSIILYRLITTIYIYIIPIIPNIHILIEAILGMLIPYMIYMILEFNYGKKEVKFESRKKTLDVVLTIIFASFAIAILALVSCQFKYGALVIGSGSMTGTINKGDVIIYERTNEDIKPKDIIVFWSNDIRVIHRVINTKGTGDGTRYYTKGDANPNEDENYRTKDDIIGKVRARIPYIGQFTVLLNEMFE